jgi:hypothetical protein
VCLHVRFMLSYPPSQFLHSSFVCLLCLYFLCLFLTFHFFLRVLFLTYIFCFVLPLLFIFNNFFVTLLFISFLHYSLLLLLLCTPLSNFLYFLIFILIAFVLIGCLVYACHFLLQHLLSFSPFAIHEVPFVYSCLSLRAFSCFFLLFLSLAYLIFLSICSCAALHLPYVITVSFPASPNIQLFARCQCMERNCGC